jgi:hypothetical protein
MSERQEFHEHLNRLTDDDRQMERLLASLVPRETRVNRDRVMFLAGQASAGSQKKWTRGLRPWMWPAATVCSSCLGLIVGLFLGHVPSTLAAPVAEAPPGMNTRIAAHEEPESFAGRAPAISEKDESFSLLSLQNRMLAAERSDPSRLADALGNVASASHPLPASTYSELLRQMLAERS